MEPRIPSACQIFDGDYLLAKTLFPVSHSSGTNTDRLQEALVDKLA